MVEYKCFICGKIVPYELVRKRVRCPYCGSKILYKSVQIIPRVKAR
ncbi:MAG: DNA-directed polymerase subunit [Candidatus Woesearchaeota archaeon]|nr:DNA-directed polymerase subunit [Candidatus Woesearchaeota archaeon]MDN5327408.1 DNA-directed polymerase subunit [Candidatus Woesearchaeota archaeon]